MEQFHIYLHFNKSDIYSIQYTTFVMVHFSWFKTKLSNLSDVDYYRFTSYCAVNLLICTVFDLVNNALRL